MKKSFLFLCAALAMVSCKNVMFDDDSEKTSPVVDGPVKNFTFTVKGDFGAAQFKAPRRANSSYLNEGDTDMTDLWVFDYMGGTLVQKIHQTADDDEWGRPKMSLPYGEHHLYFVASRGADPSVDESGHVISWSTVRDTFWKDYEVNVVSTSNGNRAVTLDRVATKLRIVIDDKVPDGLASISVTPDRWYYGIDYMTGNAVSSQKKAVTVSVPETYIGTTGQLAVRVFGLSGAGEWTTNVGISASDGSGNDIGSASIVGAPFKRNRATEYHGSLFGSEGAVDVSVSTDWEDGVTGTW